MQPAVIASPKTGRELVDEYFIENRTRVLEIAAFLDRLERADPSLPERDFRVRAFREALAVLGGGPDAGGPDAGAPDAGAPDAGAPDASRVERIQMLFSDPTTEPLERLDEKSARGAYDRWQLGVA